MGFDFSNLNSLQLSSRLCVFAVVFVLMSEDVAKTRRREGRSKNSPRALRIGA
jgi:hypothetical protein